MTVFQPREMSPRDPNPNPRLTQHLMSTGTFAHSPLVVVDVGARGGFARRWLVYGDDVRFVGFEPDSEECSRLNHEISDSRVRFYPVALHRDRGKRPFFVAKFPASSGFYENDMRFWRRFLDEWALAVVETIDLDTVDFDTFAHEHGIPPVDFMKIDVEGAELDVLHGAEGSLRRSVLGIDLEVRFRQINVGGAVFADIDEYLRRLGFQLWDLRPHKYARKVLSPRMYDPVPGATAQGQVFWGDALYLRDAVHEMETAPKHGTEWDETRLLKLASFMETADLSDCALELVQEGRRQGVVLRDDSAAFVDLLVPKKGWRTFTYESYLKRLRSHARAQQASRTRWVRPFLRRFVPAALRPSLNSLLNSWRNFVRRMLGE